MAKGPKPKPPEERFWRFVNKTETCWLWTGGTNGKYGVFKVDTRRGAKRGGQYAHRYSYTMAKGPIPDGLVINHLCITPLCVRPDHLEAVTYRENSRYGNGPAARKARQTTCVNGHPLDALKPNGTRRCNTCSREKMRQRRLTMPPCTVDGCDRPAPTRGLCPRHYEQWLKKRRTA